MKNNYTLFIIAVVAILVALIFSDGLLLLTNIITVVLLFTYKYLESKRSYFLSVSFNYFEIFELLNISEYEKWVIGERYKHLELTFNSNLVPSNNVTFEYYILPEILSSSYHIYDQQNKDFLSSPNSYCQDVFVISKIINNKSVEKCSISFGLEDANISEIKKQNKKMCFWVRYTHEYERDEDKYIFLIFDEKCIKKTSDSIVSYEAYEVSFARSQEESFSFNKLESKIKKIEVSNFNIWTGFRSINERGSNNGTRAISDYLKKK